MLTTEAQRKPKLILMISLCLCASVVNAVLEDQTVTECCVRDRRLGTTARPQVPTRVPSAT